MVSGNLSDVIFPRRETWSGLLAWSGRATALLGAISVWISAAVASQAEPLRITGAEYPGDLPTLIAERDGHFASTGTEFSVTRGPSGSENLKALRAGETDFALMAMTPLALDVLADPDPGQPDDPVILANLSHARPLIRILRLDAGSEAPDASLAGLRVGVPRGTNADYAWHLFRSINDIGPDEVTVVDMRAQDMAAGLEIGRIDVAVLWDPWARDLKAQYGDRISELPRSEIYVSRWLLVARRETVERETTATLDILRAYKAAVDWIQVNPEAAQAAMSGSGDVGPDANPKPMIFDVTLDWTLFTSFRQKTIWARSQGHPDAGASPGFLDMIAGGPLAAIAPGAVLLPRSTHWPEGYAR